MQFLEDRLRGFWLLAWHCRTSESVLTGSSLFNASPKAPDKDGVRLCVALTSRACQYSFF